MALDAYRSKRRLEVTPEPGAVVKQSAQGNLFVVHKHAARRLHYDLRLELGGALKSWAVPKGPSLDPQEKRLAVHVEDHPLDYADFEGAIPKGEYGGGAVMLWDRGSWSALEAGAADPQRAYDAGKLKFRLEGEKLRGAWMLVRLKPRPGEQSADDWLLFKERDAEARSGAAADVGRLLPDSVKSGRSLDEIAAHGDVVGDSPARGARRFDVAAVPGARTAPLPERFAPQLATLSDRPPRGDGWLQEIKFDGYRVICRLDHGAARLFTRRGADWSERFPTLRAALAELPVDSALLDGEVVYLGADGHTSFPKLASALQGISGRDGRLVYYVFDLPYLNDYDLTAAPLLARKEALKRLLARQPSDARVRYVDHLPGSGDVFFRQACALALEGSISKRADAPYRAGRGRDWRKIKCLKRQELVIGGFTARADSGAGIGALLVGVHDEAGGPLRYAGRVGTGWNERTMNELRGRLEPLTRLEPPFADPPRGREARDVTWVRPELVAEVEYLDWGDGGLLRHASFEALRTDKPAAEVVRERPSDNEAGAAEVTATRDGLDAHAGATAPPRPAGKTGTASKAGKAKTAAGKANRAGARVTVGGVAISHPERIVYPDAGLTKLDLARYYESVGEQLLPWIAGRPLTIVRCPEGSPGACFFQKHATGDFPEAIIRVPLVESGEAATGMAVDSLAGVLSLVQLGTLELHVWGARIETLECPDQMVFDLDPAGGLPFARVVSAARIVRDLLEGLGLAGFVKTSGGKGLHVLVPITPTRPWDEVKEFSRALAEAIARADPEHFTAVMSLRKRTGKTFVDYLRNGRGATFVAPYSTRSRPGAPVSLPLHWDELSATSRGDRFTVGDLRRRLGDLRADPWEGYESARREITEGMRRALGLGERSGPARAA